MSNNNSAFALAGIFFFSVLLLIAYCMILATQHIYGFFADQFGWQQMPFSVAFSIIFIAKSLLHKSNSKK